jgi:hypothetical protein
VLLLGLFGVSLLVGFLDFNVLTPVHRRLNHLKMFGCIHIPRRNPQRNDVRNSEPKMKQRS